MKKLGLRALAGGLALLMVAGLGAPAAANAQDDLLILAPAKELKVLEITKDMVDEDGEIVISGGEYDRIVISRDVDAKDIYFDQVVVKEMVVESGNKTNVQLWEVDADQVTVSEPQIEAFPIQDLLPLLKDADDKTRQAVIDAFNEHQADAKAAKQKAPTIITMEDAKVDALVARANAKLDLGEGKVDVVALEAGETSSRANVTLSNYEGNVTYKGGEGFSAMNLKAVDSRIKTLTVDESATNNYFTLTAQDAVVLKAEVAGNASVILNAPMGEIEVTEAATAANIAIMNVVEDLKVAGKDAKVELSGNANVTFATVTSDNVKITGVGSLGEADLQGKGAYVSTFGTKVKGENTYVPYTIPVYDSWSENFSDADLVAGVPTDGGSMNWATYAYDAENGYGIVTTTAGWQGFAILLDNRDNGSSANYTISLRVKKLGGATDAVRVTENPAWPMLADLVSISDSWTYVTAKNITVAAGEKRVILIAPEVGQEGVTMELAVDDVKVERYTEWTEPKGPEISNEAYTIAENFTKNVGSFKGRGTATASVKEGAMYVSGRTANWHGVEVSLDKEKTIGRTLNVSFKVKYDDDAAGVVKSTLNTSGSAYAGVTSTELAKADEWVTVTGTMTVPTDAEYVTFYFEADSTTASFYIDDVVISTEEITDDMLTKPDDGDDNQGGAGEAQANTYTFKDLNQTMLWDATSTVDDAGAITLTFPAQYKQAFYEIPADIDVTKLESITFNGLVGSSYCIKLQTVEEYNKYDGSAAINAYDNATVATNGSAVKYFVFMSNDSAATADTPQVLTVESVTFNLKEEEVKDTFTFKELEQTMLWDATSTVDDAGAITLTFPAQYKQAFYEIPADIDVTKLESITFNGLVGSSYCIKLQTVEEYNKYDGSAAINAYDNATVATNGSAVKYFVFMSNDSAASADAPQVLTVESVTFNLK